MKRSLVSSLVLALAVAGCGAETLDSSSTRGNGATEMEGPDSDGNFYVVGFAGAARPGETVTLTNADGLTRTTIADADGSFAAILWSSIDKTVEVTTLDSVSSAATLAPQKINVNYATRTGLESVPGLGPALSMRILEHRELHGLFAEVSDLEAVDGIGPTSVQNLAQYVETKIDINVASKNQLMALPTIGAAKASSIIAYRNAYGPFVKASDLMFVISVDDYQAVKPFVKAGEVVPNPGATLVDVNKDTIEELMTLPGIGEGKAKAIVDYRTNHGKFYAKDDLLYVPGIGPATLANIRDRVTVGILDRKVGTFTADGSWTYKEGIATETQAFPNPVLVKFEHSIDANELLVTFVGGGYCNGASDCAPFTLKGRVLDESATQGVRYRLSGYMPSPEGEYRVFGNLSDEGLITDAGATIAFRAINESTGSEYKLSLNGLRILE